MKYPPVRYEIATLRSKSVILIYFSFHKELQERVKQLIGVQWSQQHRAWYVPDTPFYREKFKLPKKVPLGKEVIMHIDAINQPAFVKYVNTLVLRGYSQNTINTYRNEFAQLLYVLKKTPVESLDADRLRSYFLYCIQTLKLSENTMHSRINAVKFYFEQILMRDQLFFEIPRPKKPSILPKVINAEDIRKMLQITTNLKHNTMLKLCYGMGLRVSEIVSLKITDIDSKNMQVLVERGKGKKDRYVNLPESVLVQLRTYFKAYRPKKYLFEGQYGDQYSIRSAQQVFTTALRRANINKKVGIHGLRHSFATHLLEAGTDISFIKELMGHDDIKTTLRYTHVGKPTIKNIKSPLDKMDENPKH